jgi:NDP-sugar pyrophosphorylase family protein
MQVVILAGGLGMRLRPITNDIPKVMVPINGRPFLEHQLTLLKRHGVTDVVLCIGHFGEKIKAHFGDGEKFGLRIRYSEEGDRLLGTAGAVKKAQGLLDEAFFVTYGDAYLMVDYAAVMKHFKNSSKLGLMVVFKNSDKFDRSNVVVEGDLVKIYNKKKKFPGMDYIDFGVSALRREALDLVPDGKVVDLEKLNQELIKRKELLAYETSQRFYEIGRLSGLREFEKLVSAGQIKV